MAALLATAGLMIAPAAALAQDVIPTPAPPLLTPAAPPPTPAQKAARDKEEAANIAKWRSVNAPPTDPRDFTGVWWTTHYMREIRQEDGSHPPMTKKGQDAEDYRIKRLKEGNPVPDASTQCLPSGIPHSMVSPYPIQFIYTPGLITILFEVGHDVMFIHMDNKPAPKDEPLSFTGYSRGHWEGNTLVVVTDHLNDRTTIDQTSLSHGTKLKVTQRFTKIVNHLGGVDIEDLMTVDDPDFYSKPWTARRDFAWRGDTHEMEYVCEENNRNPATDGGTGLK